MESPNAQPSAASTCASFPNLYPSTSSLFMFGFGRLVLLTPANSLVLSKGLEAGDASGELQRSPAALEPPGLFVGVLRGWPVKRTGWPTIMITKRWKLKLCTTPLTILSSQHSHIASLVLKQTRLLATDLFSRS